MRPSTLHFSIGALILSAAACSSGNHAPTKFDDAVLRVGGTYATSVTLGQSSCPNITVQNMATTVTHSAGSGALSLEHADISASGSVTPDGGFTTGNVNVAVGKAMHNLAIAGKFSVSGFEALLTVTVIQPMAPASCVYQLAWIGTKQGARNTIPGS